ncbi:MAG: hypothetical protein IKJ45_09860 [Kiritimatiellae bacterium]|nr:hypothetical protein [Kiritimatiellia bacterium]
MEVRPIDANALIKEIQEARRTAWFGSSEGKAHYIEKSECAEGWVANAPEISLNTLRDTIYQDAVAHGLWEEHDNIWLPQECHSLIENEVDELYESLDEWANSTDDNNERFVEELADVVIMCFSVAGKLGIDIDAAIRRKMEINKGRAWKHGKE